MTYIIAEPCVGTCDTACVEVCPVDCIHGPEDREGAGAEAKEDGFDPTDKMLYIHPEECIDCGACEPECPNNAIYEGGADWKYSDGTSLKGMIQTSSGIETMADDSNEPVDMDVYYIVSDKCTECVGFHDEPQCAAVCPVDCCVDDPDYRESEEELLAKKDFLHL